MNPLKTIASSIKRALTAVSAQSMYWNSWQLNSAPPDPQRATAVATCVAIYAGEAARTDFIHYKRRADGTPEKVLNSPVLKVLSNPNPLQSKYDFFEFLVTNLMYEGNGYAYAPRNGNGDVTALYPLLSTRTTPFIEPEEGTVFYQIGRADWTLDVVEEDKLVPSRNVLNVRINARTHPLVGMSNITFALASVETAGVIQQQNQRFFENRSRASGILSAPGKLGKETVQRVETAFSGKTSGDNIGKVPLLDSDIKFYPMNMNAVDSELVRIYKQSIEDVAMIFRIPQALLGIGSGDTMKSTETLMRTFTNMGLGSFFANLEQELTKFFDMPEGEYLKADLESAILRGDLKERMDAYAKAVQGGVKTPNEVRAMEGLEPKEGGDDLFLQQQMVPLKVAALGLQLQPKTPAATTPLVVDTPPVDPEAEVARILREIAPQGISHE